METEKNFISAIIFFIFIFCSGFFVFKDFFKNRSKSQTVQDISLAVLATVAIFTLLPLVIAFLKAMGGGE